MNILGSGEEKLMDLASFDSRFFFIPSLYLFKLFVYYIILSFFKQSILFKNMFNII